MTRTISDEVDTTVKLCLMTVSGGALISQLFNLFSLVSVKSDWRESQSDFREHIESTQARALLEKIRTVCWRKDLIRL